ncbi:iron uptake porin [Allocoleopsis franciscana]|uniref:Putative S-layer protein n=1 Tax=Allocoleopsis franciscana PCC 7113 TaxID=1173027 RepID=K9WA77_9CYAN|nr:iron uptake porin [Allocoleopsis franciscana]AFZ17290.1 putative S-layer protein [Allocoleopsis franciscana PCC 7113]
MSKLIWNTLKASPILLVVSLLVTPSARATQYSIDPVISTHTVTVIPREPAASVQPSDRQTNQPSQSQIVASSPTQTAIAAQPTVETLSQLPESTLIQPSVSPLMPKEASGNLKSTQTILAQQVPPPESSTTEVLQQIQQYNSGIKADSLDQVTNVNQLSDVRPTDWAYEALRSLVERYGCIAGYPDGTYRGNRAMTRYEFAAGVNACLQQMERIIQSSTENFVTKPDLETIQRLVNEFRTELTALGGRVDQIEGRVASLEAQQFSTTTKLRGEAVFAISDLFGDRAGSQAGNPEYTNDEAVFQNRVRLNFDTSFTGKDLLRTRLQAANIEPFGPLTAPSGPGLNVTREGRFAIEAGGNNNVALDKLFYRFPVNDIAQVYLFANQGKFEDVTSTLNPSLEGNGTGALSRFGRYSPIYYMGGQSQGAGVSIGVKNPIRLDLAYLTDGGNNPNEKFGLFDGNHSALAQVTYKPSNALSLGATYVNTYDRSNLRHGTGSIASQMQWQNPVNVANRNNPVVGNSYGLEASFAFSPQVILSGWGAYTNATVIGKGNADIWTYGATLAISDVGSKGSTLGLIVGMEPKLTGSDSTVGPFLVGSGGRRSDRDTGLHIEALYKYKLSPNILITPGVIWLTAPGHDSRNDDIFIGTVRTTFTF